MTNQLQFSEETPEDNEIGKKQIEKFIKPGADAIKKITPSLGIPYLGV